MAMKAGFIESIGLPSIKALSVQSEEDVYRQQQYHTDYYLFDAPGTDYKGGSGRRLIGTYCKSTEIPTER